MKQVLVKIVGSENTYGVFMVKASDAKLGNKVNCFRNLTGEVIQVWNLIIEGE